MATKLEQEEYLYRRAIDIIESADTDDDEENFYTYLDIRSSMTYRLMELDTELQEILDKCLER